MSGDVVDIPRELLLDVYRHAREAFPAECCGWLAGPRGGNGVTRVRRCRNAQAEGHHPTASERTAETAYVFADDELLEMARGIDGPEPARVIYHSHTNGRAYFSATDLAVACGPWGEPTYPVAQLVVGIDGDRVVEAALFAWDGTTFVEVARYDGAAV